MEFFYCSLGIWLCSNWTTIFIFSGVWHGLQPYFLL